MTRMKVFFYFLFFKFKVIFKNYFYSKILKKITKKKSFWSGFAIFRAFVLVSHQTIVGVQK